MTGGSDARANAHAEAPAGETAEFRSFAARLSAGEGDAATQLLARYSARLLTLARRRLGTRLAAKSDPEDVVQSVLRTFFRRLGTGDIELRDWSALSGLLSVLTLRKCHGHAERFAAARRDVGREVPLRTAAGGAANDPLDVPVPDRDPTAEEVVAFADLVGALLGRLAGDERRAVELLLAGETIAGVAADLGVSERTVQRTLAKVRLRLASWEGFGEGGRAG